MKRILMDFLFLILIVGILLSSYFSINFFIKNSYQANNQIQIDSQLNQLENDSILEQYNDFLQNLHTAKFFIENNQFIVKENLIIKKEYQNLSSSVLNGFQDRFTSLNQEIIKELTNPKFNSSTNRLEDYLNLYTKIKSFDINTNTITLYHLLNINPSETEILDTTLATIGEITEFKNYFQFNITNINLNPNIVKRFINQKLYNYPTIAYAYYNADNKTLSYFVSRETNFSESDFPSSLNYQNFLKAKDRNIEVSNDDQGNKEESQG